MAAELIKHKKARDLKKAREAKAANSRDIITIGDDSPSPPVSSLLPGKDNVVIKVDRSPAPVPYSIPVVSNESMPHSSQQRTVDQIDSNIVVKVENFKSDDGEVYEGRWVERKEDQHPISDSHRPRSNNTRPDPLLVQPQPLPTLPRLPLPHVSPEEDMDSDDSAYRFVFLGC